MMHRRLHDELAQVASRYRRLRLWRGLAIAWLAAAAAGGIAWVLSPMMQVSVRAGAPLLAAVGFLLAGIMVWRSLVVARNHLWIARQVEQKYPELKSCLLAAIEQESEPSSGRFGYLQSHVIHEALDHARARPWADVVPRRRIAWAMASSACSLAMLVAAIIALGTSAGPQQAQASVGKAGRPDLQVTGQFGVRIEPGNTEVERGSSLLVLARITGPVPPEAALTVQQSGKEPATLAMNRSLEDPLFGTRIPDIREPLDYRVETGGMLKGPFHVDVFEYPRVEKADAELVYPAFTKLEPKLVQDVRTVTVVEGTTIHLTCHLNKAVASAVLLEGETPAFELQPVSGDKPAMRTTILADRSRKLALNLVDDKGRKNKVSWNFTVNVVPNNPVVLKPVFPGRDMEVSPLEEMDLAATAWDDFGVEKFGISYSLAGKEPVELVLGEHGKARHKNELAHRVELETLGAAPDDLLSYHWWAEDLDSSGQVRRVEGDMYFAEVRKFEEIFREGEAQARGQQQQQQQQGQGQNEQSAEQLAQLQKEVINATWKLVRREHPGKLTEKFPDDVEGVRAGQLSALEKAAALGEKVTDPKSMAFAEGAVQQMEEVANQLTTAKETSDPAPLKPALAAAQSAYQNLLKLRAREHQVTQQQQSQSSSRSQSRSQQQRQQMRQLDLKKQDNPYESQRTASENQQETAEQREDRQALNRLRELARRQHDLNERLKELQAALEEAKSENEKEELRRQLKRLQEEQRQVVQDADELASRMEQPENQERMAEQRQQLEQARDQAQRASEAIEQEMAGQAAASGTRAEQEFEDLREEFRRRSSNRFAEDVRQLSDAANELDQKQKEIARQMGSEPDPEQEAGPKSLADNENKDQTAEELARQRQRLSTLQERMRKTIEEAEQDEPLLTKRLYDAVRDLQDQNVEQALAGTEQSLRRGFSDDAKQLERVASQGIEKLNENMKSAAEAVLGDDTEALRRAREELQRLAQELNDEIARNDPNGEPQNQGERPGQNPQGAEGRAARPGEQGTQRAGESPTVPSIPGFNNPAAQPPRDGQPMPGEGQPNQASQGRPGEQPNQDGQRPQQPGGRAPSQSAEQSTQEGRQGRGRPQQGQLPGEGEQQADSPMSPSTPMQPMGEQPGQQPGEQPGQQGSPSGQSQRPGGGQGASPQPGQWQGGLPQPGQGPGQDQEGQPERGEPRDGQRGPDGGDRQPRGPRRLDGDPNGGGFTSGGGEFNPEPARPRRSPITGDDFREWSDRLRDVEEMVSDPELRAEAARIRERARGIRSDVRRHSEQPKWDVIRRQVAEPLLSLRDRVADEVVRRASRQAVVPLDRDPVPPEYAEKTRAYYERLGTGR
ncbi:hypothetical protein Pan44_11900 [Caulifigura coniformis]|uniref:Immunoglobulin G-binding protein A n=1 Tax=Caulifigura coniformis TaxID=2527983 RepID=A0A517SAL9_9PLAN|nr:hypothetical protein [Caulifigura coniformis]QDT53174.1 hypothetical protein Pan44_11900 [Caulifigura coniformis]